MCYECGCESVGSETGIAKIPGGILDVTRDGEAGLTLNMSATPEDQRTDEALTALSTNAKETTYFVVQMFMDKFNQEAESLKSQD